LVILQTPDSIVKNLGADEQNIYNYVQQQFGEKYNLKWLKPVGFNNSYCLMMRREQSKRIGVNSISDLKNYLDKK
jgi:osmoprotectant transport system permease protein